LWKDISSKQNIAFGKLKSHEKPQVVYFVTGPLFSERKFRQSYRLNLRRQNGVTFATLWIPLDLFLDGLLSLSRFHVPLLLLHFPATPLLQGHHNLSSHATSVISAKRFNHSISMFKAKCLSLLLQILAASYCKACLFPFIFYCFCFTSNTTPVALAEVLVCLQSPGFLSLYADDLMLRRFGFPMARIPQRTPINLPASATQRHAPQDM
jgi:hypothetical protein